MTGYIQVLTAVETEDDAQRIVRVVVEKRLAACAHVVGPIASTYWWKGKVETTQEWLCVFKSKEAAYEALEREIRSNHPYEVPEILAVPVVAGSRSYLDWIETEVR